MSRREVTELDFRMPEYRDAKAEDYEFRADGNLVRKDRWEQAVQSIRFIVGVDGREFEIPDVVAAVRKLAVELEGWVPVAQGTNDPDDLPDTGVILELRLIDGSILKNGSYTRRDRRWFWNGADVPMPVREWRESPGTDKTST